MTTTVRIPLYLELQLKATLEALTKAVREKGLEGVLEYELWELRQQAREALAEQDCAKARRIIDGRHAFIARVNALPARQGAADEEGALLSRGH